jgi:hypothetical protein
VGALLLFLPGTILLVISGLICLKSAHRRIKPRRVVVIVLIALAISWLIWSILNHVSQPPSPEQGLVM